MTTLRTICILKTIICVQVVSIAALLIGMRQNSNKNCWTQIDISLVEYHNGNGGDGQRVQPPVLQFMYKNNGNRHRNKLTVFNRIGYQTRQRVNNPSDWDVAWMHELPPFITFNHHPEKSILPYQKMNHIPLISLIMNKNRLLPEGGKFIPLAYRMPDDGEEFVKEVKSKPGEHRTWVQKSPSHRGVHVRKIEDLQLDNPSIIQEFIDNPFLIDGHKFNMGFYVIITSVTPLRAYEQLSMVVRMCREKYISGNYSDVSTYVTDMDNNIHSWQFPGSARFFDFQYTNQRAAEILLENEGGNFSAVLQQAREAIRDVLQSRIGRIRRLMPRGLSGLQNSLFDFSRWDVLLDDQKKLHLIEANLSPDFEFRGKGNHQKTIDSFIFNGLRLALVADVHKHGASSSSVKNIRDSDLNAGISICLDSACGNCDYKDCYLCSHCMSREQQYMLKLAYAEHINSNRFRRVYPEEMTQEEALDYDTTNDEHLQETDRILRAWYRAKCIGHTYWCG